MLPKRARAAFKAGELTFARQFAEECLALAASAEIPEFFRNDGNAVHYSHMVLGRVALRDEELEKAKAHLIESGRTTGSPNLGSFGPNMRRSPDVSVDHAANRIMSHDSDQHAVVPLQRGQLEARGGQAIRPRIAARRASLFSYWVRARGEILARPLQTAGSSSVPASISELTPCSAGPASWSWREW